MQADITSDLYYTCSMVPEYSWTATCILECILVVPIAARSQQTKQNSCARAFARHEHVQTTAWG